MKITLDEIVACYLLDRADQYVTDSGCWKALADAAANVMLGEHTKSYIEGEFDEDLIARVRKIAKVRGAPVPVDPTMGVDPATTDIEP